MRKRDELTKGCMAKAHDSEMTFVLLGRDVASPATIRFWISERIRLGKNHPDDAQIREAEQCAKVMEYEREAAATSKGFLMMNSWQGEGHAVAVIGEGQPMPLPDNIGHIPTAAELREQSRDTITELRATVEAQRREINELRRRIEDMGVLMRLARSQAEPPEGR